MSLPPSKALEGLIRKQIESDGPIPFDRFMEYALYHPEYGYYRRHGEGTRAGPRGDFITAPTLTPLFGAAIADFVAAAWERFGRPPSWWLAEAGGGIGALCAPLVLALREKHGAAAHGMHVALTDQHPEHLASARDLLQRQVPSERLHVADHLPRLGGRPAVIVANELFDNLPVRLLCKRAEGWFERCVSARAGGGFEWVDAPAAPWLVEHVTRFGIDAPMDHQVEVPVGAHAWLEDVTKGVGDTPTVLLLIDYGETARDLVGEPRAQGTLMAYEGHRQDRNVLERPGERDVTAHVNWTDVARTAAAHDWRLVGYTKQSSFLTGLGLMDRAAALAEGVSSEQAFAALQAVKEVMLPGGMGESFKVLALARNLREDAFAAPWPGFQDARSVDPRPRGQ